MLQRRAVILIFFALAGACQAVAAEPLDAVFAHIDATAKTFKGMTADISNTQHTALVDTDDVQTGTIKLLRVKPGLTRILIHWKGATGEQIVELNGNKGRLFNPHTNTVDEGSMSDAMVNQLLLLGFGASSAELKADYDIAFAGDEKLGAQQTSHLRLISKSPETRRNLKQADLWYADNGLVVQQKFLYPSGDFKLVKFSNMKPGAMPEKDLELKLPANVTIQKH